MPPSGDEQHRIAPSSSMVEGHAMPPGRPFFFMAWPVVLDR